MKKIFKRKEHKERKEGFLLSSRSFAVFVLMLLSSCSLTPHYERPETAKPEHWKGAAAKDEQMAVDWWKQFGSDELNAHMQWALEQNNDLRASIARIRQARATARIANATLFPSVDGSAGTSWSRTDGNNKTGWNAGLDVSYEADLFGANKAGRESAEAGIGASIFDRDALALTVMADVARGYFNVLNLREQVDIARSNLKITNDLMAIIDARFKAGAISGLEVAQQRETVRQSEASLASAIQSEVQAENALAVLEGLAPQDFTVKEKSLKGLTIPRAAALQPSLLLTRRPDIRADEQRLIAANANIGAARAAFFPSLNLGTGLALAASPFSAAAARSVDAAASLIAPIFEGGRLEGNLELSKARRDELVETYRKTVLTAFQEGEDALAARTAATKREKALLAAQKDAQTGYDISLRQYKGGAADFQTLLNAQRDLLSARNAYVSARFSLFSAAVDVFKAMGGGWQEIR